jgi:8-oxo-dGTP diphosphatase
MATTIIVSKALIVDAQNDMLVLRRSKTHPSMAGLLDLPGGLLEENEGPAEAIARETLEETGLNILPADFQLIYAGTHAHDGKNRIRLLFIARLQGKRPEVKISWEHDQVSWLPIDKLQNIETKFHPFYVEAFQHITEHDLI